MGPPGLSHQLFGPKQTKQGSVPSGSIARRSRATNRLQLSVLDRSVFEVSFEALLVGGSVQRRRPYSPDRSRFFRGRRSAHNLLESRSGATSYRHDPPLDPPVIPMVSLRTPRRSGGSMKLLCFNHRLLNEIIISFSTSLPFRAFEKATQPPSSSFSLEYAGYNRDRK